MRGTVLQLEHQNLTLILPLARVEMALFLLDPGSPEPEPEP